MVEREWFESVRAHHWLGIDGRNVDRKSIEKSFCNGTPNLWKIPVGISVLRANYCLTSRTYLPGEQLIVPVISILESYGSRQTWLSVTTKRYQKNSIWRIFTNQVQDLCRDMTKERFPVVFPLFSFLKGACPSQGFQEFGY